MQNLPGHASDPGDDPTADGDSSERKKAKKDVLAFRAICSYDVGEMKIEHETGVTLAELAVGLAIVGIMAGIVLSLVVNQMPKYRLAGATRQIVSDLMGARMKAVSQGNEFKVTFVNKHEYTILDDDDNDGTADAGELLETRDIHAEYEAVTLTSNNNPIFHPRGTASNWATIRVTNEYGTKEITVTMTGHVNVAS